MHEFPRYIMIDGSWVISNEIYSGQWLISLVNFMKSVTLVFDLLVFFVTWINGPCPVEMFYNISTSCLFLGCGWTFFIMIRNFTVEFYGQTTIDFPPNFPVGREMVKQNHVCYVFPIGITTAIFSLLSAYACSHIFKITGLNEGLTLWNGWQ